MTKALEVLAAVLLPIAWGLLSSLAFDWLHRRRSRRRPGRGEEAE